jgi:hypothetical protein
MEVMMRRSLVFGFSLLALIFGLAACGEAELIEGSESNSGGDSSASNPTPISDVAPVASGLRISKVTMLQTVNLAIMEDHREVNNRPAPVVAGKDAIMRVYVSPDSSFQARNIVARLSLQTAGSEIPDEEISMNVRGSSSDDAGGSTFNFLIESRLMTGSLNYSIQLFEASADADFGSPNPEATWPAEGKARVGEDSPQTLKIVLVPVQYSADGSGREPDTGPAQVKIYEDMFEALYPTSNIELTVRETVNWTSEISAFGQGWGDLLSGLQNLRYQDNADDQAYYYGVFSPASSYYNYCNRGCVAGLSTLATDYRYPSMRTSIGLGYSGEEAADTMVHEVGHAHGREHAPCGLGGQSSDNGYPNTNANLDQWGFDMRSTDLLSPSAYKDMMSYCSPIWISAYTYNGLYNRMSNVNTMSYVVNAEEVHEEGSRNADTWLSVVVEPTGEVKWGYPIAAPTVPDLNVERKSAHLIGEDGTRVGKVEGIYMPFGHGEGGILSFPPVVDSGVEAIEFQKTTLLLEEAPRAAFID